VFTPGATLAVVASIDGEFLAALPQDDQSAEYSRFSPVSIAFRPDQMLVIADGGSERILGLPLDPGLPRHVYVGGFSLRDPHALRTDPVGNIYAADGGQRVVEVVDARFRLAGEVVPPYDALGLVQGRISGIAFNPLGELYLSDPTNGRIYRYDASGRYLSSFTGGEEVGWGQLLQPEGLACANGGAELYVCDAGKRQIAVFDPSGMPLRVFGGTDLAEPWAIAVDINGQSYVADRKGQTICIFDEQGRLIDKIEGPRVGNTRWLGPTDVVIRDSSLVVADPPSGRVVIMKVASPK
jgi:DNA-binding beta-propeller fold protein YncE